MRDANRSVHESFAPHTAERIGDDDSAAEKPGQLARRTIGIFRKERDGAALDVGAVDAGVRADETVVSFADKNIRAHAHDPAAFPADDFDQPGVLPDLLRKGTAHIRRLNRVELHDTAFRLRDDLLGDGQNIAVTER